VCKKRIDERKNLQYKTEKNKGIRARQLSLNISTKGEKTKIWVLLMILTS
jgi:hypothetical protein